MTQELLDVVRRESQDGDMAASALVCSTCHQAPEAPFRRVVDGVVVEGCVSAAHDTHADAWHQRPSAVAIRAIPKPWADLIEAEVPPTVHDCGNADECWC